MNTSTDNNDEACLWLDKMLDGLTPETLPNLHRWLQDQHHVKALADAAMQNQSMRRVLGRMERHRAGAHMLLCLVAGVALGLVGALFFAARR